LDEAPAGSGHVVDKLWLVQPKTVKVDDVHIGAQARQQPTAIPAGSGACRSWCSQPMARTLNV